MRWLAKAAAQGAIGVLPRGESINYQLQRKVSKRLPRPADEFDVQVRAVARHIEAVEAWRPGVRRAELRCYEFGAGWDLIGPLSMWALGFDRQTIIDIKPHVKLDLVNGTIREFAANPERMERLLAAPLRALQGEPVRTIGHLESRFGIVYRAPLDAASVPLPDESFDLVTSTFTLEHIPGPTILSILRETRRIMAPEAVFSSLIDMQDHYSYIDPNVSPYNFLRYRPWLWRLLNPSLQWQSRLRHSQYLALFADAGFEIVSDQPQMPSDADLRQLDRLALAPEFHRFSTEDLGTRSTHLVVSPG
ncbi:MAG: class I SAM-dependent methyltransferase [Solirubrobacteraceae bacterium]